MNNEEVLASFAEYLQTQPLLLERTTSSKAVAIIHEFAAAIEPFPLDEATLRAIKAFERDHKPARMRNKYLMQIAKLRYYEIQLVMLFFRQFRSSVLKSKPRDRTREDRFGD